MTIYSTALPYVYICTHKQTGQFYIGYREANKLPAGQDLPKYKTSSKVVRQNFDDYSWSIVAEFVNGDDAYDNEQRLIFEAWNDTLLINGNCRYGSEKRFKTNKSRVFSEDHKANISKSARGRKLSDETKAKVAEAARGRVGWNRGQKIGPQSEEHKRKLSESVKSALAKKKAAKAASDMDGGN